MKAEMERMKATQSLSEEKSKSVKKETSSSPREMFSDAITPKVEKKPKVKASQQQSGKTTGNQSSPDSTSGSPGDGSQPKKKKYTMDAGNIIL